MHAAAALSKLLRLDGIHSVIDIGSGDGKHARILRDNGKDVLTVDLGPDANVRGDFMELYVEAWEPFDAVWVSHCLEHQRNVGDFLDRCYRVLRPLGILAVTVPPLKHHIVGGHLTLWNAGLLLYNLILAGFDCRDASIFSEGYDVSVLVRKPERAIQLPELAMDRGDIERLSEFFPKGLRASQGFDGQIQKLNW